MLKFNLTAVAVLISIAVLSQESRWASEKEGKWRFENHLPEKGHSLRNGSLSTTDNVAYRNNVATLAEWFRQNHPMLKNPKGYDVRTLTSYVWSDYTTRSEAEFGIPSTIGFLFELFYADGGKWTVEPPQYRFDVNALFGGHDGFFFTPESIVDDGSRYDRSLSEDVDKALRELTKYFRIYPLKEQPCPGVDIYQGFPGQVMQKIVVYNPDRPPYWLPVTVKEMADAHLAYYSLIQKREIDRMVLEQLKQEIAELSQEELAAPAFAGHDSHFALNVNGKGMGSQIMRFNPAYWDRNLPVSAIQFMTFWNACLTEEAMNEQKERAYPAYPQLFVNQINWNEVAKLIQKQ